MININFNIGFETGEKNLILSITPHPIFGSDFVSIPQAFRSIREYLRTEHNDILQNEKLDLSKLFLFLVITTPRKTKFLKIPVLKIRECAIIRMEATSIETLKQELHD